jgi:O-succinylbenzoate synthase
MEKGPLDNVRIDSIELRHIRMRLKSPFETSFGVEHDRDCLIVQARGEGLAGWGECVAGQFPGYSYETVETAWHVLAEFFIPAILDQEFNSVDDLHRPLGKFKGHNLARAGLELAMWDMLAKAQDMPLSKLLGGTSDRVPVGVSIGIQQDADRLIQVVGQYVAEGYKRVKVKIRPGRDVGDIEAVRTSFPDLPLQVDANSAYSLDEIGVFEALDHMHLLMIEQPLAEDDLIDHSRLQARLQTPICLDESILSARHARQALEINACRVINIKQGRVGGLKEAVTIHDLCHEATVPVWCGGMLETGIGRAANLALASLPGFALPGDISATDRYYVEDIATPRFTLNEDSTIDVPHRPGLGVDVDQDALESVTLRRAAFQA